MGTSGQKMVTGLVSLRFLTLGTVGLAVGMALLPEIGDDHRSDRLRPARGGPASGENAGGIKAS